MLVLTRQKNDKVVIQVAGLSIEITVVETRGDRVRIGFDGPRDFKIIRSELIDEVKAENKSAATLKAGEIGELGAA